jgi:hypothetical protein
VTRRLAKVLRPGGDLTPRTRLRQAIVAGITGNTVSIQLGGDSTVIDEVAYLAGYTPRVADVVWCLQNGPDLLVINGQSGATRVPTAKVTRSTNQTISNSTNTLISFSAEAWDTDDLWTVGSPTRLTIQTGGYYALTAGTLWASDPTGRRLTEILLNGSTVLTRSEDPPHSGTSGNAQIVATIASLSAGDYVELRVFQSSGGSLDIVATLAPHLEVTLLPAGGGGGAVGPAGPTGPTGPTGPAGPPGGSYVHAQAVPAATWTVNHGLGMNPNITAVDSAGTAVIGQEIWIDANTIQLDFSAAFAGEAYVS